MLRGGQVAFERSFSRPHLLERARGPLRTLLAAVGLALVLALPGCGADRERGDAVSRVPGGAAPPVRATRRTAPDGIRALEGVSVVGPRGSVLAVARATVRNRTAFAGFITYDDFSEVLLVDTQIRILDGTTGGFSSMLAAVEDGLIGTFVPDPPHSLELEGEPATALPTRLVFEGLSIEQHAWEQPLLLRADRARLGLASGALVLEDGVVVVAPDGTRVEAPQAVLAGDHAGLFLPRGYRRDGAERVGSAFLALDSRGRLSATPSIPEIRYEDLITQREQLILAHYADRAPPALRPLILAVLGRLGAADAP